MQVYNIIENYLLQVVRQMIIIICYKVYKELLIVMKDYRIIDKQKNIIKNRYAYHVEEIDWYKMQLIYLDVYNNWEINNFNK